MGMTGADPREIEMCLSCKSPECAFGSCLNVLRLRRRINANQKGGWKPEKCYTFEVDGVAYTVRELVGITGRAQSTIRRWIKDGSEERIREEIWEAIRENENQC